MTTRLDRLILLLDKGTSSATRNSAAQQIGEILKNHPHELHSLISRVQCLLKSKSWETRVAAAMTISEMVKNVPQWDDMALEECVEPMDTGTPKSEADGRLRFDTFDIRRVLDRGHALLGSSGKEYEYKRDDQTSKEKLEQQKNHLISMLDLQSSAGDLDIGVNDLEEDVVKVEEIKVEDTVAANEIADKLQGLTARERLRLKRLAKGKRSAALKVKSSKSKTDANAAVGASTGGNVGTDLIEAAEPVVEVNPNEWPFENLCDELRHDLFDAEWEVRHGAGSALRDVIKTHGSGGGKVKGALPNQNAENHNRWLEDIAIRLLCIFALDKFSDFGSDQAVAPVRETCAQSLGALLPYMDAALVARVLSELLHLLEQDKWEVRHGGLLGVKYILAVRSDLAEQLLPTVLPAILGGLIDDDDDVRAVAAEAARPIVDVICAHEASKVSELLSILWDTLSDLDDLTASTSSVLSLLAELLSHKDVMLINERDPDALTSLVPKLFPFFRHSTTAVRKATLRCLSMVIGNVTPLSELEPGRAPPTRQWLEPILPLMVKHLFQNMLLEEKPAITELNNEVWTTVLALIPTDNIKSVTQGHLQPWLTLLVTPMGGNFNEAYLVLPPKARVDRKMKGKDKKRATDSVAAVDVSRGPRMPLDPCEATRLRLCGCRALAEVALKWPGDESAALIQALQQMIDSNSNVQRIVAATIISDWMGLWTHREGSPRIPGSAMEALVVTLHAKLTDTYVVPFVELEILRQRLREDASALVHSFLTRKDSRVQCEEAGDPMVYNEDMAMHLCTTLFDKWSRVLGDTEEDRQAEGSSASVCRSKQMRLLSCVGQLQEHINVLTIASMAALSECCVILKALPPKLNPIIRPLMDSIKTELDPLLQERSAKAIAALFDIVRTRTPCPIPKITKNLCASACADVKVVPVVGTPSAAEINKDDPEDSDHRFHSIYTLQLKTYEANSTAGPGRKSKQPMAEVVDDDVKLLRAQANGGRLALQQITKYSGPNLFTTLPNFWPQLTDNIVTGLQQGYKDQPMDDGSIQPLVNGLYATKMVIPALDPVYHPQVLDLLPYLINGLGHPYKAVRYMCATAVAAICQTVGLDALIIVIRDLLPLVNHRTDIPVRQGSVEAIYSIIDLLGLDVLTYLVFFMGPVLSRMTDQNMCVRQLASFCFAALLRLMPLEAGAPDPPGLPQPLKQLKLKQREFLELLADSSKITDFPKPATVNADLRAYQQEGFNWLCFLRQYGLHGVLGDDMGLGKTLQSICLMVYDNEQQRKIHEENRDEPVLPHLVICPSTLVAHWYFEIEKFTSALKPLMYHGPPADRRNLQRTYTAHDVIIVSYDVVRNDLDFFSKIHFSYCILDEGHIIKNVKAKITKAAKSLHAEHRLILSGTPIQNNVVELWSLFDFLMPGFLSTDRVFQETYSKPIMASRDAKSTAKEAEAGAAALEALHRQMLPFMMRRVKEDVLKDLPPKIIQDLYCDLSQLQKDLYNDFQNSSVKSEVETEAIELFADEVGEGGEDIKPAKRKTTGGQSAHVFQALQYLRKLCTHPALVLTPTHPQWKDLARKKLDIKDIVHAPKLIALKQLLHDCGLGITADETENGTLGDGGVSSNHRVLIFCQHKAMLDLIEQDLFKALMPGIIYLRMDGSVESVNRFAIVSKFNADPTIDVLLLTTHVGGLGLNLTGADTVVFVEHDWNPMKDLQAMDRAHRIGQKKVVSVYRLITKNTLEEKVMGLQKFKLNIANSVITSENASMRSMDTTQLLDLFNTDEQEKKPDNKSASTEKVTIANAAGQLEELWDENQYDDEYDMNSFLASLKKE